MRGAPRLVATNGRERDPAHGGAADAFLARLLDGMRDAVLLARGGRVLVANDEAARLFGRSSAGEVVGCDFADFAHDADRELFAARVAAAAKAPRTTVLPAIRLRAEPADSDWDSPSGEHFVTPRVIAANTGAVVSGPQSVAPNALIETSVARVDARGTLVLTFRDVTERERTSALRQLVESGVAHQRDAVLITEGAKVSPVGRRILFVNKAFTTLTGFSEEEAIGCTPSLTIGEGTRRDALARIGEAIEHGHAIREELLKYRKDGSTFWAEVDIAPVTANGGTFTHFVCVMRDVTERHTMMAKLAHADRLSALGTLAAGMAHEVNNPLAYVLINLDDALDRLSAHTEAGVSPAEAPLLAELSPALEEAREGARRVRDIVRSLKAFSRADSPAREPTDLAASLEAALTMTRSSVTGRAVLRRDIARGAHVMSTESELVQVFVNLIINAAQAIDVGSPSRNFVEVRSRLAAGAVIVEVEDSGAGMDAAVLDRVFEPFFTTKVCTGTGLGLAICHGIVQGLGGTIEAESTLGQGSVFRVTLPTCGPPGAEAAATERRPRSIA